MASFAHVEHPSQHYVMVRTELAAQTYQHMSFTIELLTRLARRIVASVAHTIRRRAAAHRQAVQDRMFWELAMTDPRVMAELRAINDYAELNRTARGN